MKSSFAPATLQKTFELAVPGKVVINSVVLSLAGPGLLVVCIPQSDVWINRPASLSIPAGGAMTRVRD